MTRRHTWTDGPLAFLLEKAPGGPAWLETNGGSRESVDGAQAIEILCLAEEVKRLKGIIGDLETADETLFSRGLQEGEVAERARIRRELLEELPIEGVHSSDRYQKGWNAAARMAREQLDRIAPEPAE